jgi:hypothetical protein
MNNPGGKICKECWHYDGCLAVTLFLWPDKGDGKYCQFDLSEMELQPETSINKSYNVKDFIPIDTEHGNEICAAITEEVCKKCTNLNLCNKNQWPPCKTIKVFEVFLRNRNLKCH